MHALQSMVFALQMKYIWGELIMPFVDQPSSFLCSGGHQTDEPAAAAKEGTHY